MVRQTKTVSKLTVLPPLNLPSLRREHEKYDASGRTGGLGVVGVGGLGSGSRPSSTCVGWTKIVPDKNGVSAGNTAGEVDNTDGIRPGSGNYGSRSAPSGAGEVSSSATRDALPTLNNAVVLRGEEFPSLQAARSTSSGMSRKEKFGFNEKQKQVMREEVTLKKKDDHHLDPQGQSSQSAVRSGSVDNDNESRGVGGGQMASQNQKQQEYFPDPLPLVRLNPRSDWADDERDTGYRFVERERDAGYSKSESYWDRDFDFPRTILLPQKPVRHQYERWGSQDYEAGKNSSSEVLGADASRKDFRGPTQGGSEGNRWGTSQSVNDGISASSRATSHGNAITYNKYTGSGDVVSGSDSSVLHKQDSRADFGFGERKQYWNNSAESNNNNRGVEHYYRNHIAEQSTRYKGDNFQNNKSFKSATVSGRNMPPANEPVLAAVRDKRFSKDDRSLLADPFLTDFDSDGFDERDFFSGSSLRLLKRKKDAAKPTEFHDPVRESFEAELERIQKLQELERQRIVEEQEKALEKARREDEERQKMIREEKERQRLLEGEAREAAWRAEKEKQEAVQRSEEQRIAREEERRRMLMEEERRKQAAKQKLLELEAKIAKREAEASKADASVSSALVNNKLQDTVNEKYITGDRDLGTWEDEERMLGKVMTSSSSTYRKPIETNLRYSLAFEGSSNALEGERVGASFRSPLLDHEIGHYRPNLEAYNSGRMVHRKEPIGKSTYTSSKFYGKEEIHGRRSGVLGYQNEPIWNLSGDVDPYEGHKERESEVHDSLGSVYDDIGWEQGHLESSMRSRYSMRQPRVLPPPLAPVQRSPSAFLDNETRRELTRQITQGDSEPSEVVGLQGEATITEDLKPNLITRCDSQSSLVVSSPPNSPPHLSEEEFDETVELPKSDIASNENNLLKNGSDVLDENHGKDRASTLGSMSALDDEDWPVENYNKLQRPDEYDEEEDNYREENDACDNDNLGLSKKLEELDIEDRLVLGFNEGSKVIIPSDDLAENLGPDEMAFVIPESSAGIAELVESVLPYENAPTINANCPSVKIAETGLVSQGSTGQSVGSFSAAADILEGDNASGSAGLPVQHNDPFPGYAKNVSSQNTMNSTSSVKSLVDFPLNRQFGLFPGPSLLPPSVSAIQIGSIQIPIHDHHHVSPASTHTQSSQPSMFQFGQLRFTAPVSLGILPETHKSTSSVHPSVQDQISMNHSAGGPVPHETGRDAFLPNLTKEKEYSAPGLFNGIDEKLESELGSSQEEKVQQNSVPDSNLPAANENRAVSQFQRVHQGIRSAYGEKNFRGQRGGINDRGRRFAYAVKGTNPGSSLLTQDFQAQSNEFHRKPRQTYWTRDKSYRRQVFQMDHSTDANLDNKAKFMGKARSGPERSIITNKRMREKIDLEPVNSGNNIAQGVDSGNALPQTMAKKLPANSEKTSRDNETSLGRKFYEEDVDAALQSGIVCVFRQPGIEAPSDEDDFIEVRSKRNFHDRRKQREREIKAKLSSPMQPRKPQTTRPMAAVSRNNNKLYVPSSSEISSSSNLNVTASQNHQLLKTEVPTGLASVVSQNPSGASAVNSGVQSIKSDNESGAMSESRNKVTEHSQASLTHWSMEGIDQQVKSLTQTQLDEAMKSAPFDSNISNIGAPSSIKSDQLLPTPIFAKDKSFPSGASAVNSLLAGEKIQFALPPSNHVASDEIGAPGSNWSDVLIAHNIPESKNDGSLIFRKDVRSGDTCSLTDHEAEAKRNNSAAGGATLSEKEVVADELSSATAPDTKNSDDADIDGVVEDRQPAASQSLGDDSLTASLPADLSVETTQLSLWPPLPSPQSDSSQMLSHFPGGPPSHFPFYDMNCLLDGPIFDSGSPEESSGTQPQLTSTSTSLVPPVNWQHHHSFYGPPTGYPGPFMSPIGVQGPPHMVLYDHFAPVAQFGQVGLSLMGPTYFPHGKQSDWKHNPTSSAMHGGEGNIYDGNMAHLQSSAPSNSLAPIRHLAPGSPLMSAPSPLPVFDVPPFQPEGGLLPSQVSRGHPTDHRSSPISGFPEQPQIPGSVGGNNGSSVSTTLGTVITPFSAELGLVDSLPSTEVSSGQGVPVQVSSGSTNTESGNNGKSQNPSSTKTWFSQKNTTANNCYNNYQRVGMYQRNNAGNDWSNRRTGFHGRKQSYGAHKVFPSSKMRQIYVPKETNSGTSDK